MYNRSIIPLIYVVLSSWVKTVNAICENAPFTEFSYCLRDNRGNQLLATELAIIDN